MPSGKYEIYVNDIIAPKQESIWKSGIQKKDKIVSINGTKINTTYSLLNFIRQSKSYDGKIDEHNAMVNFNNLKAINPVLAKDEIIPPDVAVELPEKLYEQPIKMDYKVMTGMKMYKDTQITLTDAQKKLRDSLKDQKMYISDGTATLKDLAYAISDNSRPVNIKVERNGKIIDLAPIFANNKGIIGIKLKQRKSLSRLKPYSGN